jgi:hypothetical protein
MEKGRYYGFYKFDNDEIRKSSGFTKTNFTIEITKLEGEYFSGWVEDDISTGGMEGRGIISGYILRNRISFVKQMPHLTMLYKNKTTGKYERKIDTTRKHLPIYYEGTISGTDNYVGKWNFRYYNHLINILVMFKRIKTGGTWEMSKVN